MDFTKFLLTVGGIIVASFFLGLFGYVLIHIFPLISQVQDIFIGIFKLMGYHTSSMVVFGTSLFGYISLKFYFLAKSIIS